VIGHLVEIWKQNAIEDAEGPEAELKERTVTVLELSDGLGLVEAISSSLGTLTGTGSKQKQLDREL
jgi:hypothetical protein